MSALPHLYQRLRCWLALAQMRARAEQLRQTIETIEAGIDADHALLCQLRQERLSLQLRLRMASGVPVVHQAAADDAPPSARITGKTPVRIAFPIRQDAP